MHVGSLKPSDGQNKRACSVQRSFSSYRNNANGGVISGGDRRSRCASGLPPSGSWQDLKDHMREAGDVCYADVYRDGTGVVEYVRKEDMSFAIRKLDNTKFRSHEVS